jgi:hypothetical protein
MTLRFLPALIAVSYVSALAAVVHAATPELLGQPCRAFNVLSGRVITDPAGREQLVLANMNEISGAELIFIDLAAGTGKTYRAPAGQGAWALNVIPDNRLAVGTFYDGTFMIFDLNKMQFTQSIKFPGEEYIWNLALAGNGKIYGGTYPGGKLGALDLTSYKVEDLGAPAKPNLYLRNVSATPDGRLLCQWGMEKPTTMLFDPKTGKYEAVPKTLEGVQVGVTWNGYFLGGNRVYRGDNFDIVTPPPFPTPEGKWGADAYITDNTTLYLRAGNKLYRYRAGDKELALLVDLELHARVLGGTSSGGIVGVRGPDYFVLQPGATSLNLKPIPVESSPRVSHFLEIDQRGRLWGGPTFGQTLFYMDTDTRKIVNTSLISNSGGEVYDVAFLNGKTYAAAYAGGEIIEYDPSQPWDQWNNKNPRVFAHLTEKGYIRPIAGILTGDDGKLYSGWMAKYGTYGGAIAITDPSTDKTELIENPLGEQAISGLAYDGQFLYIGSSLEGNGLPKKTGESPSFGIIDLSTRKVVFSQKFPDAAGVNHVRYDGKTRKVTMQVAERLHVFDTQSRQFLTDLPADLPTATGHGLACTGDGMLIFGHEKSVIQFDLATNKFQILADAPAKIEALCASKTAIYFSCGPDVYRLTR